MISPHLLRTVTQQRTSGRLVPLQGDVLTANEDDTATRPKAYRPSSLRPIHGFWFHWNRTFPSFRPSQIHLLPVLAFLTKYRLSPFRQKQCG